MENMLIKYAMELLAVVLKHIPPGSGDQQIPSDWINSFRLNPERLFQDARDRAKMHDYGMAHKLFKLAEEIAKPENTRPLPDKTKFSFYVLWSSPFGQFCSPGVN